MTRHMTSLRREGTANTLRCIAGIVVSLVLAGRAAAAQEIEANRVAEIALLSEKTYENPFMEITLYVLLTQPDGSQQRVPAFWAGGNRWCFRYASSQLGQHAWRTECSDTSNPKLHGVDGKIEVTPYQGDNLLYLNFRRFQAEF